MGWCTAHVITAKYIVLTSLTVSPPLVEVCLSIGIVSWDYLSWTQQQGEREKGESVDEDENSFSFLTISEHESENLLSLETNILCENKISF